MIPVGMQQCRSFFEGEGLPVPYLPQDAQEKIEATEKVFSTRKSETSIYDITAFVTELLSKPTEDYVMLGVGGHGIASQALHYYAVKGPLALFIQLDAQLDSEEIKKRFIAIEKFYSAMTKITVPANRHFVFIESQQYGSGWGWVDGQPGKVDPATWHQIQQNRSIYLDAFLELAKCTKK